MKKSFLLPAVILVAAIVFLFTGCPNPDEPTNVAAPTITMHTALIEGADFQLTWTDNAEGGAEIFYIYAGSADIDSTNNLSYTIGSSNRASSVAVTAWIGNDESSKATHDLSLAVTTSLDVWTITDPSANHPSFVKFTNGNAATVNWDNRADATFYINGSTEFQQIADTVSSVSFLTGFTEATATPYNLAPAQGNYTSYCPTSGKMTEGATYYMFIDNSPTGAWGIEDYFAKIEVVSVVDDGGYDKCTLKISYQTEAGLRWLVD